MAEGSKWLQSRKGLGLLEGCQLQEEQHVWKGSMLLFGMGLSLSLLTGHFLVPGPVPQHILGLTS